MKIDVDGKSVETNEQGFILDPEDWNTEFTFKLAKHENKEYEKHIYSLFPTDPIHELCKLTGLPMPQPDT